MIPPCPFCQASDDRVGAKLDRTGASWRGIGWYVECDSCLARGPRAGSLAAAIAKWGVAVSTAVASQVNSHQHCTGGQS